MFVANKIFELEGSFKRDTLWGMGRGGSQVAEVLNNLFEAFFRYVSLLLKIESPV
jgi:hypothetical protein